jgi:hypothetical protein
MLLVLGLTNLWEERDCYLFQVLSFGSISTDLELRCTVLLLLTYQVLANKGSMTRHG